MISKDESIKLALLNLDHAFALVFGLLKGAPDSTKEELNYSEFREAYSSVHKWLETLDEKHNILDEDELGDDVVQFYSSLLNRFSGS